MIFFDTETVGLHGYPIIIQYAIDDGPIQIHNIWKSPISETLELIEMFMSHPGGICGFNLAFDHFHLCKTYTTLSMFSDWDQYPEDLIDEIAELEPQARDGVCLKPITACDLFLHARKGPYQSTMDRHDIRIKRVPTAIAYQLAGELERRIPLKDVYFARRADKTAEKWKVYDIEDQDGKINKDFKDVVLKFAPSSGLKALAADALGVNTESILTFAQVEVDRKLWPEEKGFAPFAKAIGKKGKWNGAWPEVIVHHIRHWSYNNLARQYATDDVKYTRMLYEHFGRPEPGDDDSVLACMVAAVRWRGFKIDIPKIKELRAKAWEKMQAAPTDHNYVKKWIWPDLTEEEIQDIDNSTKKVILEGMTKWRKFLDDGSDIEHPAAVKAKAVIEARTAAEEVEVYDKLLLAGRFHASFKVIGTLSSRMSGADGLNPQGIKKTKDVRSCFPLAHGGMQLVGGDFESFEVVLAAATYNDEKLYEDLTTKVKCDDCDGTGIKKGKTCGDCKGTGLTGKKIHTLFAMELFPEENYESIMATKGSEDDKYTKGKQGVFSQIYGGDANTLVNKLGVSQEVAEEAAQRWAKKYPGIGKAQQTIFDMFCVTDDVWTMTSEGPRQIKDLINENTTLIVNGQSYNTKGFFNSGEKEVFLLKTEEGYSVKATANHPFFVNRFQNLQRKDEGLDLWTELKNLRVGDKVRLNKHYNIEWNGFGSYDDGYLVGWLYGDGSLATRVKNDIRLYLYPDDFCMLDFLCSKFYEQPQINYIEASNCYYLTSPELLQLALTYDIRVDKKVNEYIETASSDFIKGFISAFFDTDGSSRPDVKQITLSQSDLPRLQAVQRILLRFGIKSDIKKVKGADLSFIQGRKVKTKDAYRLSLYAENVELFHNRIGFNNPTKKQNTFEAIRKCHPHKRYKEHFLVTIKTITSIGKQTVYDITVPGVHAFDANGFFVHNCSMRQPGGLGTKVTWNEPAEYIESMLGFPRYFTLENQICKALFTLAENPPKEWQKKGMKVQRRREGEAQTAQGAARSALFGAAFAIQAANMRAAANHQIQSSGAQITKRLERNLWELQPGGIHPWKIQPMNVHDEIMAPTVPELIPMINEVVKALLDEFQSRVPLIAIDWSNDLKTWADK